MNNWDIWEYLDIFQLIQKPQTAFGMWLFSYIYLPFFSYFWEKITFYQQNKKTLLDI